MTTTIISRAGIALRKTVSGLPEGRRGRSSGARDASGRTPRRRSTQIAAQIRPGKTPAMNSAATEVLDTSE